MTFNTPVITSTTLANQEIDLVVSGFDVINTGQQSVTYEIICGADDAKFSISPNGVLSFDSPPDFEIPGSAAGTNTYEVQVSGPVGGDTVSELILIEVTDDPFEGAVLPQQIIIQASD